MKNVLQKQIHLSCVKSANGKPGDDDLKIINTFTLREHSADELYVRTMYLAHTGIDRDREVIDSVLMDDFVESLPGKGLFIKHPMSWDGDSGPGKGRFFKASKVAMSQDEAREVLREPDLQFVGDEQAYLLEASFYMVSRDTNNDLMSDIDAGIAGDVSIGFSHADRTPIKDASDNVIAYRLQSPGQAYEGSLVWLGAQPGARIHKNASIEDEEDGSMELKQQLETLQKKHDDLTATLAPLQAAETELKTIKAALGEDTVESLKARAAVADQYKNALIDDVVQAERVAGLIEGDDKETIEKAKAAYADFDIDRLKTFLGKFKAMPAVEEQIDGGDPGATGADDGDDASKDADSPLNNKAVTG